ncbi:hypothetical protein ACTL32_09515 [Planococcus sp. FY231025]
MKCDKKLGKIKGNAEIKCPKCANYNHFSN